MASLEDRLRNVHPNARKKVRPGAKYVSRGLQEYEIKTNSIGHFYVSRYKGGELPVSLRGTFTSFRECEQALISHLRKTDKWGKAVYPNG